tara:strand:+ start:556 stop:1197 length:642 start_codon:yes stop_codon:yes gene_type:complete
MVLAHPDDEILFGWPVFLNNNFDKKIIMCSTDANNKERTWCSHRKDVMKLICDNENTDVTFIDNNSSFYKTKTRRPAGAPVSEAGDTQAHFRKMCKDIENKIIEEEAQFDFVFTHNPYGEYGHCDHKLLFDIVLKTSKKPILITDIVHKSNWSHHHTGTISKKINNLFYNNKFKENCILDNQKFEMYKSTYQKYNCWTWWREETKNCNLYLIE